MTAEPPPAPTVEPITDSDLDSVAGFLHRHLDDSVSASGWRKILTPPWAGADDTRGYLLRHQDQVVGVYISHLSPERPTRSGPRRFLNLAEWCVLDEFRAHSIKLLMTTLARKDLIATELSPRAEVAQLATRLGFTDLRPQGIRWPILPIRGGGRVRTLHRPEEIAEALPPEHLRVLRDHTDIDGLHHVVLVADGRPCHVMYRVSREPVAALRGREMPFALVLHVSDRSVLPAALPGLHRHLLARRIFFAWSEDRIIGTLPPRARDDSSRLTGPRLYKGRDVDPDEIDYLYSDVILN